METIAQVIHECETCSAIKQSKRLKPPWYGGLWLKYKYGEAWQIDYITLPQTRQGKRYVLTMVQATTRWLETYPVPHATAWNTILGLEKQTGRQKTVVPGTGTQVLAAGAAGAASVRRGRGCPVPDTAGSSRLQGTHPRAWLSPSAKVQLHFFVPNSFTHLQSSPSGIEGMELGRRVGLLEPSSMGQPQPLFTEATPAASHCQHLDTCTQYTQAFKLFVYRQRLISAQQSHVVGRVTTMTQRNRLASNFIN
ncbi:hypothetical protein QYF61_027025, partial [Mycteria americana]